MDGDERLARLRAICLALPEATEQLTWESVPTFRVRDRIFAQYEVNGVATHDQPT